MLRSLSITVSIAFFTITSPSAAQTLGPCPAPFDSRWECGSLRMPENRQTERGRTIDVEVKVRRADNRSTQPPIFQFSGGPGAPTATGAQPNMFSNQAATHDLVLIDQRGTGRSNGFKCSLGLEQHANRAFGQLYPMDQINQCHSYTDLESDPNQYTTGDFAADVEAVRERLGYPKIIVSGGSYGTRSAMTYMAEYPDRIAGAVLNGVMPPDDHAPLTYARSVQDALDRVFADCLQQTACAAAYPNLADAFNRLMDDLHESPADVNVQRPDGTVETVSMRETDLGYAVRIILYNRGLIPQLPKWIHQAATTGDLTRFAQAHYNRAVGILDFASIGLHFSVFCAEDIPYVRDEQVAAAIEGTFFGSYFIDQYREGCRQWPIDRRDRRSHQQFTLDAPVLLLSGRYDPITPETFAESVKKQFPNSRHIVQGDGGHGAGGSCVNSILRDFYEYLNPSRLTNACSSIGSATFEVP